MTGRQLLPLFKQYNALYFRGRLHVSEVRTSRTVRSGEHGRYDPRQKIIWIRRDLDDEKQRRALLHEMCHVGSPNHGTRWRAKMLRLAQAGETWAASEANAYKDRSRVSSQTSLRDAVDDVVANDPDLDWPTAKQMIATICVITPGELDAYPWVKSRWLREMAEAARQQRTVETLVENPDSPTT